MTRIVHIIVFHAALQGTTRCLALYIYTVVLNNIITATLPYKQVVE